MKELILACMVLLLMGCEDLNTFCPKDTNSSNTPDTNTTNPDKLTSENILDDNTTNRDNQKDTIVGSDDTNEKDANSIDSIDPDEDTTNSDKNITYILHTNIKAKLFWIGQPSGGDESAWDNRWKTHYGGTDTPDARQSSPNEYKPTGFNPRENPFYVALPYNDMKNGEFKYTRTSTVPWASEDDDPYQSICKNKWVKITANNKTAYAQWEDVGPYGDGTDAKYVFGGKKPLNSGDANSSGISISPAVRDLLGLSSDTNETIVKWIFIEKDSVPSTPWKNIVTTRPSD